MSDSNTANTGDQTPFTANGFEQFIIENFRTLHSTDRAVFAEAIFCLAQSRAQEGADAEELNAQLAYELGQMEVQS